MINGATSAVTPGNSGLNSLPSGNICPFGKILKKIGLPSRASNSNDTLMGKGSRHYGHGSIMRSGDSGAGGGKLGIGCGDLEEMKSGGNEMYKRGKFVEALALYDKSILLSPDNTVYQSNRVATLTALGRLSEAVKECEAVRLDPGYARAHQRFDNALSLTEKAVLIDHGNIELSMLGRWAETVKDYEALRQELPHENEVLQHLHQAENALKKYHGQVYDGKLGGEVEEVCRLDKFKAGISSPGVAVVHFKAEGDDEPDDMSPFMNMLCVRYPSIHLFKVDVGETLGIAKAESIRMVPTFKVYKNIDMVKEIVHPSH
ncbi:unnamed protein product [Linum tenue]|uniref:Thioredoxin domain-containing protein n=1 Tax=Linum tenue TaxID=586396 RepID=A0AAV0NQZ5_9ROSI|nr:unnamed protein product [Linum tenue]